MTQEITREDLRILESDIKKDVRHDVDIRFKAFETNFNLKFNAFTTSQEERYELVDERYQRIEELLKPIAEMYSHTTTLGKWIKASLLFLTLVFGFFATAGDGFKAIKVFLAKIFS